MTHIITSKCNLCRQCTTVCPVECIVVPKDNPNFTQAFIDPDTCIDCGACVPECAECAIFPDNEVPDDAKESITKNKDFFTTGPGYSELKS
jgi:ferredoxin--NADP+ reductase